MKLSKNVFYKQCGHELIFFNEKKTRKSLLFFETENLLWKSKFQYFFTPLHRGAFCQFLFRWIYYCHSNKSTGKVTGKTHLCALCHLYIKRFKKKHLQCLFCLKMKRVPNVVHINTKTLVWLLLFSLLDYKNVWYKQEHQKLPVIITSNNNVPYTTHIRERP